MSMYPLNNSVAAFFADAPATFVFDALDYDGDFEYDNDADTERIVIEFSGNFCVHYHLLCV